MGKIYQVVVQHERMLLIDLCNTEEEMQRLTVGQLKEKILEKLPELEGKLTNLCLIFGDKRLIGDTSLLSEYGIQHMSSIHLIVLLLGGGPQPR
uniref:Ubiquitin-like domain-containing protein n=1 Tax=Poecilia reticulata TaxID=8081 RepID=A0A3P9NCQ3_POERE